MGWIARSRSCQWLPMVKGDNMDCQEWDENPKVFWLGTEQRPLWSYSCREPGGSTRVKWRVDWGFQTKFLKSCLKAIPVGKHFTAGEGAERNGTCRQKEEEVCWYAKTIIKGYPAQLVDRMRRNYQRTVMGLEDIVRPPPAAVKVKWAVSKQNCNQSAKLGNDLLIRSLFFCSFEFAPSLLARANSYLFDFRQLFSLFLREFTV